MKERSIIYTDEMLKARDEGRKTMTRSVIVPQPHYSENQKVWMFQAKKKSPCRYGNIEYLKKELIKYAKWQLGDIMLVKEDYHYELDTKGNIRVYYKDSYNNDLAARPYKMVNLPKDTQDKLFAGKQNVWKSKRFMFNFMIRKKDRVTGVKAEQIQDISEEDAIKEGIERLFKPEDIGRPGINDLGGWTNYLWHGRFNEGQGNKQTDTWEHQYSDYKNAKGSFSSLWESINAKRGYSWESNPWVFAYEFERLV